MKISTQNSFNVALDKLSEKLPSFLDRISLQQKQHQAIQLCLQKGNQLLKTVGQLLIQINSKKAIEKRMQAKSASKTSRRQQITSTMYNDGQKQSFIRQSSRGNNQIPQYSSIQNVQDESKQMKQLKQAVSHIQLKQKQNKMQYQINLLKKHNQKLNDHISGLQKKIRGLPINKALDQRTFSTYFKGQRKIIDLQAQIQQLKQINRDYENILKDQVQKIYSKFDVYSKTVKSAHKQQIAILQAVTQLQERHDIIFQMIKLKRQKLQDLQKSFNIINNMLIKPAQTFQNLVKQVAHITNSNHLNRGKTDQFYSSVSFDGISYKSRLAINQNVIKQYQQIINRRNQINNNASRYINQLIKTIRQNFPIKDNKKRDNQISHYQKQKQNILSKGKNKINNTMNFQKKVKQLVALQFKYKQEVVSKLQKITDQISSVDNKKSLKNKLDSNKQKKITILLQKQFQNIILQIKSSLQKQKKIQVDFMIVHQKIYKLNQNNLQNRIKVQKNRWKFYIYLTIDLKFNKKEISIFIKNETKKKNKFVQQI